MILPSIKHTRLSAEALAKSFDIKIEQAREMLAFCFNERKWDSLCYKITNVKNPSSKPTDEEISNQNQVISNKIAEFLGLDSSDFLDDVVESCSPFSLKPKAKIYDPAENLFEALTSTISKMLENVDVEKVLEKVIIGKTGFHDSDHDDCVIEHSDNRLESALESLALNFFSTRDVDTHKYLIALSETIPWDFTDTSYELERGKPIFYWIEHNGDENPVFLTRNMFYPGFVTENELNDIIDSVTDSLGRFDKPIILLPRAIFKEFNDELYAVIGMWFNGNDWYWLFMSNLTPREQISISPHTKVLASAEELRDNPFSDLLKCHSHESELPAFHIYHCITHPTKNTQVESDNLKIDISPRKALVSKSSWALLV